MLYRAWLQMVEVKADLERDVTLGVLEMVEPNTPFTFCHRMGFRENITETLNKK